MACRRLGVSEVRRTDGHVMLFSSAIDNVKWEGLQRSVPEVCVYVCVRMYLRTNACMCAYICVPVRVYVSESERVCVHIFVHTFVCMHVFTYVCMCVLPKQNTTS